MLPFARMHSNWGSYDSRIESQVKELKDRILKSRTGLFDLSHYNDIHLICSVVKDFLRSLSESLLTDALWKSFASVVDEESDQIKQHKFDALLQQLPKPNRETLAFVLLHLQRVAAAPLCRMPMLNLSRTMVRKSCPSSSLVQHVSILGSSSDWLLVQARLGRGHRRRDLQANEDTRILSQTSV